MDVVLRQLAPCAIGDTLVRAFPVKKDTWSAVYHGLMVWTGKDKSG